ncbi:MAG: hypothetical protein ACLP0B_14920, partial [Steroidobacteraceae bacterium]
MTERNNNVTDVEQAEKIVADLTVARSVLVERGAALGETRKSLALDAHIGDAAARKKLDAINREAVSYGFEIELLEAAIAAAGERLDAARAAEAQREDRAQAKELRAAFDRFHKLAVELDKALATAVATSNAMKGELDEIHALGSPSPTGQQWLTYGEMAISSSLMATPWSRAFRHLAPRDRRSFT